MIHFTEEEKLILGIYRSEWRLVTVARIHSALPYAEDEEVERLMRSVIDKLLELSETEYRQLQDSLIE